MNNTCTPFVRKTYQLVSDPLSDDIVSWTNGGKSFTIWDSFSFEIKILPQYFKHNNLCSFIRQLNTYSFHKTNSGDSEGQEFIHPNFFRGAKDFSKVVRKTRTKKKKKATKSLIKCPKLNEMKIDFIQTLLALQKKQEESERLLGLLLEDLESTRAIISNLQATITGKRAASQTSQPPDQPLKKKIKGIASEIVEKEFLPQNFGDIFEASTYCPTIAHEAKEQNSFDMSAMLDCQWGY